MPSRASSKAKAKGIKKDTRLIGDKNPGYSIYPDRLKEILPDAKFIYILRDYRDNYQSIRNIDFELPIVSVVVYKWKHFYRKALQAVKKYPDSFIIVKYEELVSEPETCFQRLCEFLDLEYVPEKRWPEPRILRHARLRSRSTPTHRCTCTRLSTDAILAIFPKDVKRTRTRMSMPPQVTPTSPQRTKPCAR